MAQLPPGGQIPAPPGTPEAWEAGRDDLRRLRRETEERAFLIREKRLARRDVLCAGILAGLVQKENAGQTRAQVLADAWALADAALDADPETKPRSVPDAPA